MTITPLKICLFLAAIATPFLLGFYLDSPADLGERVTLLPTARDATSATRATDPTPPSTDALTHPFDRHHAPTAASVSTRLQAEFANARDWRAFALSAVQRPGEGGYFYAMSVVSQRSHLRTS